LGFPGEAPDGPAIVAVPRCLCRRIRNLVERYKYHPSVGCALSRGIAAGDWMLSRLEHAYKFPVGVAISASEPSAVAANDRQNHVKGLPGQSGYSSSAQPAEE
jgi:hypothetical protein